MYPCIKYTIILYRYFALDPAPIPNSRHHTSSHGIKSNRSLGYKTLARQAAVRRKGINFCAPAELYLHLAQSASAALRSSSVY